MKTLTFKLSTFLLLSCCFQLSSVSAQTIVMQGNVFKVGQTNHAGIKVILYRTNPTVLNDTIITNSAGYYSKSVPMGTYNIKFYNDSFPFPNDYKYLLTCYSNQTLNDVNVYPINGVVPSGNYYPGVNTTIEANDTLNILPGANFYYLDNAYCINKGVINAIGNQQDSILFSYFSAGSGRLRWAQGNSKISYFNFCNFDGIFINSLDLSCTMEAFFSNSSFINGGSINTAYSNNYYNITLLKCIFNSNLSLPYNATLKASNSKFLAGVNFSNLWNGTFNNCIFENIGVLCGSPNWAQTPINYNNCLFTKINTVLLNTRNDSRYANTIFYKNNTNVLNGYDYIKNCLFFENDTNYTGADGAFGNFIGVNLNGDSVDVYGNIFSDPSFVDTINSNYHLTTGSSCLDAGDNLSVVDSVDFDGNWRVYDGNNDGQYIVDIGPYEFNSPFLEVHNLGLTYWDHPLSGCNLSNNEIISIKIRNYGNMPETGFNISYSLDSGATWHNEIFSGTIAPFTTLTYNFTTHGNFSANGNYDCIAVVHLIGNTQIGNDTLHKLVIKQSTLQTSAQQLQPINCFGSTGSVVAHATGGTLPYSYLWNNALASTDSIATGVSANISTTVTVTDNLGCLANASVTLTQPDLVQIAITPHTANCNQNNGWAEATVIGGILPYHFLWSNGDSINIADSLSAGTYSLQVTDSNGCVKLANFTINNIGSFTISGTPQNVHCIGGNDGAITIAISGGAFPYTFEWSNGATTQNISDLIAGTYDVEVTDANGCISFASFEVMDGATLTYTIQHTNPDCGQNNGTINVNPTSGLPSYIFLWSNGDITSTISGVGAGIYTVTITDANFCTAIASVSINNLNSPIINIDSVIPAPCGGSGSAYITITGGALPFAYNWSNGYHNEDLLGFNPGNYTLTVTDNGTCIAVAQVEIPAVLLPIQPICMVTVDSLISRNKLVWERVSPTGVDYYKIYRETSLAGQYQFLDTVNSASMTKYTDMSANPYTRSWRYKISQVDMCGNESPLSDLHKTIHLTINHGMGNSFNLIWDDYEGYSYNSFYISRHTNALGWVVLDSLPITLHSFTETPPSQGGLKYLVHVKVPSPCIASTGAKTQTETYNIAVSNMEEYKLTGISEFPNNILGANLYPNPFSNQITIEVIGSKEKNTFEILNSIGQIILTGSFSEKTIVNTTKLASGIYLIKLMNGKISQFKKIVKE